MNDLVWKCGARPGEGGATMTRRVLVVDDSPTMRALQAAALAGDRAGSLVAGC